MENKSPLIKPDVEERINQLLAKMTINEKIGQLNQIHDFSTAQQDAIRQGQIGSIINAPGALTGLGSSASTKAEVVNSLQKTAIQESRLGIPILIGRDVIHGYRTIFPIPLGQAASWNPELVKQAAQIAAREASSDGIKWTFAPMLDIARDPRWGRVAEGFGEDPYLASQMSWASVQGYQGGEMHNPERLIACAKHFVGYGAAEGGRDYDSAEISMRTLADVYLPPYQAALDAGVATIMSAFHDLNGIPMSANSELLSKFLRGQWGFGGFVISDWASIQELVQHGVARDESEAAILALRAGIDMDMVSGTYLTHLANAIENGKLDVCLLDEATRRVLRIKILAGLLDDPMIDPDRSTRTILAPDHRQTALRLAEESIVLLKNNQGLLPIGESIRNITFAGPLLHARGELFGTWTPDGRGEDATSIVEAIRLIAPADLSLTFCEYNDQAIRSAYQSDLVVVFLGEHPVRSGENSNVTDLELPPGQLELLQSIAAQGAPVVLVILAGRPLAISQALKFADAILYAFHPGIEGGSAIANLLFGRVNPSGKLPITLPRVTGQVPIYYNHKNSGRPAGFGQFPSRYVDNPHGPLFPFGYGLSYTKFSYSNLHVQYQEMSSKNSFSVDVTNVGDLSGREIVQLYVRDLVGSVTRPVKELKGFQPVFLNPGETRTVTFELDTEDLAFTGSEDKPVIEGGDYQVWIGPDSSSGLQSGFTLLT